MFSLFAAAAHLGSLVSAAWSIGMVNLYGITSSDFSSLWKLILVCNVMAMVPLAFIPLLLRGKTREEAERIAAEELAAASEAATAPADSEHFRIQASAAVSLSA